ncbi:arylamine N-acetyltransferase (macronuclear) [Tetrahymena thermophila SB210]|uniref:Arylamine N-acetyltransferase n=2 Tax=Tetrahymena thermophila TaxID=5911 RepID=Q24GS6_TETTS|nr:arylamine N-acetyltransferase [Tetrahymena thermophila SB210]EAS06984.1 arylamine N-acetyltransferase [Tetrahymena thermophila SB210]CBL43377.1 TPA: arylamine N-acetyltransferase 4 [Tetrahymena thermophila]|eukprot:XP_001027226.1 arylamine N-acetyltransferase [Tetrahymena thermophila SB210]
MQYFLTAEETKQFSQRIKISSKREDQSSLDYLNQIIQNFQENIPFQNVFLLATPVEKRRRLTWDEVKNDLLSGQGGLCYSLNLFLHIYLNNIGYKTDLVISTYSSPNDHTVIIINDLIQKADKYMIDVGSGYASSFAIPLNFGDESPYYSFSYTTMKLKWDVNKQNILRIHKSQTSGQEKVILKFHLVPIQDYNIELAEQERIFTDPTFTPFHRILCILTFNKDGARNMQDKQFVRENIQANKLQNEGEEIQDVHKFVEICAKEFPSLNSEICRNAYNHLFNKPNL